MGGKKGSSLFDVEFMTSPRPESCIQVDHGGEISPRSGILGSGCLEQAIETFKARIGVRVSPTMKVLRQMPLHAGQCSAQGFLIEGVYSTAFLKKWVMRQLATGFDSARRTQARRP